MQHFAPTPPNHDQYPSSSLAHTPLLQPPVSKHHFRQNINPMLKVVSSKIVKTMQEADVVILGFKHFLVDDVLSTKGVREALANKLVISLLADPVVVKGMPNMGAQFRQSMTVLETPFVSLSAENAEWVFGQVGAVKGCWTGVVEGLKRADAMEVLLQGIRGLSAALEAGIHPAALRESISSPRGCTT
ncbi:hypothetical protein N7495_005505 [Penicillium taxi]|uniref:uncharacterized protein n=1 Tax=Penicillium taxi TaxID=168475 RepID=UPI002544D4D7|nr:uncharacterized protein N7495_005505 [Penicillium taxi]KAJ5893814.1 hypothetical protein N7495_005505 [Penicillium taxi]